MDPELELLAAELGAALQPRGWELTTAESCTGGWIASTITAIPGSSSWFERGFVTYSNTAKIELLGVNAATLASAGAVSRDCVIEMALGALHHSSADLSVAVSGIAGPSGGSAVKPVGTVHLAWALRNSTERSQVCHFSGDRHAIRRAAVLAALQGLLELLRSPASG